MSREGGPSAKEMGLKPDETRVLNDAELIKGGARMVEVEGGGLELTKVQMAKAKAEMDVALAEAESRAEEMQKTYPKLAENLDQRIEVGERYIAILEGVVTRAKTDEERAKAQKELDTGRNILKYALETRNIFLKGI